MPGKSLSMQAVFLFFEAKGAVEVIEARTTQVHEINKIMARIFDVLKKINFEQNDGISNEILPSFSTEAVEDSDVIFNQIQVS